MVGACVAGVYMLWGCGWQGACVVGCVCGGGHIHVWWGACMAWDVHGRRGHALQGGVCMEGETVAAAGGRHPAGMHSCL